MTENFIVLEGEYLRIYQNEILSAYVPKRKLNNPVVQHNKVKKTHKKIQKHTKRKHYQN